MLDDLPLSTKLEIAGQWFRRSEAGEFAFTTHHRTTFAQLLEDCRRDAKALETADAGKEPTPLGAPADPVYLPDEFKPQGFLEDMVVERRSGGDGNVLKLIFRGDRR